jgi:hypothetical protein
VLSASQFEKELQLAFGMMVGMLDLLKGFSGEVRFEGRNAVGV